MVLSTKVLGNGALLLNDGGITAEESRGVLCPAAGLEILSSLPSLPQVLLLI
jgi:hypothetical protein